MFFPNMPSYGYNRRTHKCSADRPPTNRGVTSTTIAQPLNTHPDIEYPELQRVANCQGWCSPTHTPIHKQTHNISLCFVPSIFSKQIHIRVYIHAHLCIDTWRSITARLRRMPKTTAIWRRQSDYTSSLVLDGKKINDSPPPPMIPAKQNDGDIDDAPGERDKKTCDKLARKKTWLYVYEYSRARGCINVARFVVLLFWRAMYIVEKCFIQLLNATTLIYGAVSWCCLRMRDRL